MTEATMRSCLAAVLVLLTACFGAPRYHSPGIVVPAAFSVGGEVAADSELPTRLAGTAVTAPAVATRAPASRSVLQAGSFSRNAFLRDVGGTTLEQLIIEAQRGNTDLRGAGDRTVRARPSRHPPALDPPP